MSGSVYMHFLRGSVDERRRLADMHRLYQVRTGKSCSLNEFVKVQLFGPREATEDDLPDVAGVGVPGLRMTVEKVTRVTVEVPRKPGTANLLRQWFKSWTVCLMGPYISPDGQVDRARLVAQAERVTICHTSNQGQASAASRPS